MVRIVGICMLIVGLSGWGSVQGQAVKYGNNETSNYGSSYKSSDYTYLMWDRNDEGAGHFVNNSTPKFFYWDNDVGQLNYLLDTGNMGQLDARFSSVGIGTENPKEKLTIKGNMYINNGEDATIYSSKHNLIFSGYPKSYAHRIYTFRPAWGTSGKTWTKLRLQTANTKGEYTNKIYLNTSGSSYMNGGKVGIGTTTPSSKLTVNGTTRTKEVIVEENVGADFVFEEDYPLPGLTEIDTFIRSNKHLPEIPTAREMKRDGVKIGKLQMKLLQKIEELTLYVIEQQKKENILKRKLTEEKIRNNKQEQLIKELVKRIEQLESNN